MTRTGRQPAPTGAVPPQESLAIVIAPALLEERREARDGARARALVAAPVGATNGIPRTARPRRRRNLIVRVDATTPDTAVGQRENAPPQRLAAARAALRAELEDSDGVQPRLASAATGRAIPELDPQDAGAERTEAVLVAWWGAWGSDREAYLVGATPAEAARLNGLARSMLVADGTLSGQVATVGGMALAAGDRVVMGRREQGAHEPGEPGHGGVGFDITAGSVGTVKRVAFDRSWVEVDFASAGWARLTTSSTEAAALLYAYATCEPPAPARGVVAELDRRLALSALESPELELGR